MPLVQVTPCNRDVTWVLSDSIAQPAGWGVGGLGESLSQSVCRRGVLKAAEAMGRIAQVKMQRPGENIKRSYGELLEV